MLPSLLHQADTSHDHTEKVSTYGWRLRNYGKLKTFNENGHISLYYRDNVQICGGKISGRNNFSCAQIPCGTKFLDVQIPSDLNSWWKNATKFHSFH